VIQVDVKSPKIRSPELKSPAQVRLESRGERSPKSPAQYQAAIENADQNRKSLLQARSESAREQFEKAKTICVKQQEEYNTKTQKIAEDISARLAAAETVRTATAEKIQEKAAAEAAKAKEAQAKKSSATKEVDEKLRDQIQDKLHAAEARRIALVNEHKEKAAAQVVHAKDVAAQQEEQEATKREDLRKQIQAKLELAESRRKDVLQTFSSPKPTRTGRAVGTPGSAGYPSTPGSATMPATPGAPAPSPATEILSSP